MSGKAEGGVDCCDAPSELSRAAQLLTSDPALQLEGAAPAQDPALLFVNEFLDSQVPPTFRMQDLLAPSSQEVASQLWADEFSANPAGSPWTDQFQNFLVEQRALENSFPATAEDWAAQFHLTEPQPATSTAPNPDPLNTLPSDLDNAWEESSASRHPDDADSLFAKLQSDWEDTLKNYQSEGAQHPWLEDVWQSEREQQTEYEVQTENPFHGIEDPLGRGIERLNMGDVANAVLLFEEATLIAEGDDQARAWQYLGLAQAENENDPAAIRALNRALQLNPTNQIALLTLAASYTNENHMNDALRTLNSWLQSNEQFSTLLPEETDQVPTRLISGHSLFNFHERAERTVTAFHAAAQTDHSDPNLLTAMGILKCLTGNYNSAAGHFRQSVSLQPDNALLWNRLGACLANGDNNEEAISAYRQALQLRPGYIRARYNIGVACINLRSYSEAVEHFLTALNLQSSGVGSRGERSLTSSVIWANLSNAVSWLGLHSQLSKSIANRDLQSLNDHFNSHPKSTQS